MNQLVSSMVLAAMLNLFLWPLNVAEALLINDRVIEPSKETTDNFLLALKEVLKANPKGKLHGLATFSRYLSPDERTFLAKLGVSVLEPYQKTTYWVSLSKPADMHQLLSSKLKFSLIPILDQDRVHPKILTASFDSFVLTPTGGEPFNYVLNTDGMLNLTVRFHVDVSEGQATKLLSEHTGNFTKKGPLTWVVVISQPALKDLAKEDSVQWIEAGPLPFLPENDMTSQAIKVHLVRGTGTPPLDGSGIRVGIFDGGINEDHPDFGNRVTPYDWGASGAPDISHGTGVAGTVAGSGESSENPNSYGCSQTGTPNQWMGIAPQALLREQSWSNGDNPSVHESLITSPQGMHLSNHSYTISNFDGEYSQKDRDRDAMIRGISPGLSIPPRLSVFSAGNQGKLNEQNLYQKGYFSLTKQLKNGLVVGNWQAVEDNPPDPQNPKDRITPTSSLGPTHDGRIKPDVVAPGRFVVSTDGPDTTIMTGCTSYYSGGSGTSFSAAAVSGSIALLLQRYKIVYAISDLNTGIPLPSTVRAILIHTAVDKSEAAPWFSNPDGPVQPTTGPDFVTGWGLVDIQKAAEIIDQKLLREDSLPQTCSRKTFAFSVTSGNPLRITLAWDDVPASPQIPNTDIKLLNDLDLVLIDPNGVRHYPWRLNQNILDATNTPITDPTLESCTSPVQVVRQVNPTLTPWTGNDPVPSDGFPPAVKGATDHLNNVELVDAPAPAAPVVDVPPPPPVTGIWQAHVIGFKVPWGPQSFSLIGADFADITVPPGTICKIHGIICDLHSLVSVCLLFPQACTNEVAYSVKPRPQDGWVRMRLDSHKDKSIIPATKLCGMAFDCPPCVVQKTCQRSFVRVDTNSNLQVGIYSPDGQRLRPDLREDTQTSVNANDFLLVFNFKPTAIARVGVYEARIQISDGPIP